MEPLNILSVAYPFAPVGPDAAGGAEQILALLDRGFSKAGHNSFVIAPEGSQVQGTLIPTALPIAPYDDMAMERTRRSLRPVIENAIQQHNIDVVHLHGYDFRIYLPEPGVPVLVTLHLPREFYPPEILPNRPLTFLNAVSASQHATFPQLPSLLQPVENGIDIDAFGPPLSKRNFALYLGRICAEKGTHLAIDAARRANIPLLIGGQVYPYPSHIDYFEREIAPRLGPDCHFLGPIGLTRKRRLLAAAQCLLVSSTVAETSSLVTREALASGTPVVAFRTGALVDAIAEGQSGYIVDTVEDMAAAIPRSRALSSDECKRIARERFSQDGMIEGYLAHFRTMCEQALSKASRTIGTAGTSAGVA